MALGTPVLLTGSGATTASASSLACGSATPTENDRLICFVYNQDGTAPVTPTLNAVSAWGITSWTQLVVESTNAKKRLSAFFADQLVKASPTSGAVTADFAGDTQDQGIGIQVIRVPDGGNQPDNASNTGKNEGSGSPLSASSLSALGSGSIVVGCTAMGADGEPNLASEETDIAETSGNNQYLQSFYSTQTANSATNTIGYDFLIVCAELSEGASTASGATLGGLVGSGGLAGPSGLAGLGGGLVG